MQIRAISCQTNVYVRTTFVSQSYPMVSGGVLGLEWRGEMSFEEAMKIANRDDRFRATIYAMNTLLMRKGVYSREEFRQLFSEWVGKEERKKARTKNAASQDSHAQTLASGA